MEVWGVARGEGGRVRNRSLDQLLAVSVRNHTKTLLDRYIDSAKTILERYRDSAKTLLDRYRGPIEACS